jgi:hypothetical protein
MSNSIPLSDIESAPSAKFDAIGDKVIGTIVSMNERQQTDQSGKPLFFDSGDPRMVWVITLHTDEGEDLAVWAKGGNHKAASGGGEAMLNAIGSAVRTAGANSVDVGARLAIAYTGIGEQSKPGFNPPKLYSAQYQAPAASTAVPVDDLFG